TAVYVSSLTVVWTASPQTVTGYDIETSTGAWPNSFSGNVSSVTTNTAATTLTFNLGTLIPDTTYFVRVGALFSGATTYANTTPASTSTLTNLLSNVLVYQVNSTSITLNWTAFATDRKTTRANS